VLRKLFIRISFYCAIWHQSQKKLINLSSCSSYKSFRIAASIRVGRYVNDFCSSEPLNFGKSRLWVKKPRGHASWRKSEGEPTEPLMKFRPSRTKLSEASRNEAWETLQFRSVSLKEQVIYAPSLRNHFCQKEQTANICIAMVSQYLDYRDLSFWARYTKN